MGSEKKRKRKEAEASGSLEVSDKHDKKKLKKSKAEETNGASVVESLDGLANAPALLSPIATRRLSLKSYGINSCGNHFNLILTSNFMLLCEQL